MYVLPMPNPLFSPYRAGENRVTSSTMAVFERIDLALVRELLAEATGAALERQGVTFKSREAVTFENQVVSDDSVPDARIAARFTWWFETKTTRNGYASEGHDRQQVRDHSAELTKDREAFLFALTPDPVRPAWFDVLDGVHPDAQPRIIWLSFKHLADAIRSVIENPTRVVGEQTRFLLGELIALYDTDGLLTFADTVIVAARSAWPEYQLLAAYICQPDRAFRDGLTHLGFYTDGAIQPLIARIRNHYPSVSYTREEAIQRRAQGEGELADLIDRQLDEDTRPEGGSHGVFLLSGANDPDTQVLAQPIANDAKTAKGRSWAWTLGQRYTTLERLKSGIAKTSDL
jgi:hypothetical protein